MSRWRTGSIRYESCSLICCLSQDRRLRRSASSKRHSRRIRTATGGSTAQLEQPKQSAIAKKPKPTSPNLCRSAQKPTPIVPRSLRRRRFWRRSEPILKVGKLNNEREKCDENREPICDVGYPCGVQCRCC